MALTNLELTDYHLYATADNGDLVTIGYSDIPAGYEFMLNIHYPENQGIVCGQTLTYPTLEECFADAVSIYDAPAPANDDPNATVALRLREYYRQLTAL